MTKMRPFWTGMAAAGKSKHRISFSTWQLSVLEANFSERQYVTMEQRIRLAEMLNIQEAQVKVWFQNRRIRWRRELRRQMGL